MRKQFILTGAGLAIVTLIFVFGKTVAPTTKTNSSPVPAHQLFNIKLFMDEARSSFTHSQSMYIEKLESVLRQGNADTYPMINHQLALFWKDSVHLFEPYIYYLSEAAKLDKSEKNLTFAAQLILDNLRGEKDEAKLTWKTELAINLFELALQHNPANDYVKIGLGSTYIFGKGRYGGPEETMKGIQQVLEVVRKDSTNMKAQLVLGIGGYVSGQYDKALYRLHKVVMAEPGNLEAMAFLADTYAALGNKIEAVKWYKISKRIANNAHYSEEVENRIRSLQ